MQVDTPNSPQRSGRPWWQSTRLRLALAACTVLSFGTCIPYAEEELEGREAISNDIPTFSRAFRLTYKQTGNPVELSVRCKAAGFDGPLQKVTVQATIETLDPPNEESTQDFVEPPWTPDLFGAEKLSAIAEIKHECEEETDCEQVFRIECSAPEGLLEGSRLDLKYYVRVRSRADLSCESRDVELEEVPFR